MIVPYDVFQLLISMFAKRLASIKSLAKRVDDLEKRIHSLEKESGGGD